MILLVRTIAECRDTQTLLAVKNCFELLVLPGGGDAKTLGGELSHLGANPRNQRATWWNFHYLIFSKEYAQGSSGGIQSGDTIINQVRLPLLSINV